MKLSLSSGILRTLVTLVSVLLVFRAVQACAYDMGADFNITSGTQMWSLDNPVMTITGANYVWTFPDAGGLNMKPAATAYRIYNTANSSGFTLDLADGAITGGGDLTTQKSGNTANGPITITNAGDVSIGIFATTTSDPGSGGNTSAIRVNNSGSFSAAAVTTWAPNGRTSGSQTFTGNDTGAFMITTSGLDSRGSAGTSGAITILDYNRVSVTGGIVTSGGAVSIGVSGNPISGPVTINGGLDSHMASGAGGSAVVHATGDILIAGTLKTSDLDPQNYGRNGGSIILLSSNGTISAEGVDASTADTVGSGGDVSMTSLEKLSINGTINLDSGAGATKRGNLALTNTAGNETITLNSLDLSKVQHAVIAPGSKCIVTGDLLGFSTNVTTQTQLRVPVGKKMIYYPDLTNNAYLAGGKYVLASPGGTPAAGGVLMPYASPGTVITLK